MYVPFVWFVLVVWDVQGSRAWTTTTTHSNHNVATTPRRRPWLGCALSSSDTTSEHENPKYNESEELLEKYTEEEEEEEAHNESIDDDSDSSTSSTPDTNPHYSRVKYKKKRFLLMQDVSNELKRLQSEAASSDDYEWNKLVTMAQDMLDKMDDFADTYNDETFRPNHQAYHLVLNVLAKAGQAGKAEALLRRMEEHPLNNKPLVQPNVITYTSVMDAYVHAKRPKDAERVFFELLQKAEQPENHWDITSVTLDTVLNAWAKEGTWQGAERAQEILDRLEIFSDTSSSSKQEGTSLKPTVHSYATVISGWASCQGGRPAAEMAQRILDRMLVDDGSPNAKWTTRPDTVVFNAVMQAWSVSGDPQAGSKALVLLNLMQQVHVKKGYDTRPDVVSYNTVLSAWSRTDHVHAARQAEKILHEMRQAHHQAPDVAPAPNTVTYNSVIHSWATKATKTEGAAERAETLLRYMIQSPDIEPDLYSFTSVLNAWAKSKVPDKAVRAERVLEKLLEYHSPKQTSRTKHRKQPFRLNQVPFNTVMNACAFLGVGTTLEQQRTALQVAVRTFKRMRDEFRVPPDDVSYGNMLKCVANLIDYESALHARSEMALQLFQQCCQDGLVSELVWKEVCRAVPIGLLREKLPYRIKRDSKVGDLPEAWRANALRGRAKSVTTGSNRRRKAPRKHRSLERRLRSISEPSYESGRDL